MRIKVSESKRVLRGNNYHTIVGSAKDQEEDIIHDEKSSIFTGVGTTFYAIPAERLLKAFDRSRKKLNKFFVDIIRYTDLEALNPNSFYGSHIDTVNNVFYLCVSDGKPIKVNGEEIDPDEALDKYTIEDLAEYTEQPSDDLILQHVTMYELNPEVFDSDTIDTIVQENLEKGVHFKEIVKDYDELKRLLGWMNNERMAKW